MPFVFAPKNPLHRLTKKFCVGVPVVQTDGRASGWSMYGHVIAKFSRSLRTFSLPHLLTYICARFARESSTNMMKNGDMGIDKSEIKFHAVHRVGVGPRSLKKKNQTESKPRLVQPLYCYYSLFRSSTSWSTSFYYHVTNCN